MGYPHPETNLVIRTANEEELLLVREVRRQIRVGRSLPDDIYEELEERGMQGPTSEEQRERHRQRRERRRQNEAILVETCRAQLEAEMSVWDILDGLPRPGDEGYYQWVKEQMARILSGDLEL